MQNNINELINKSVLEIIEHSANDKKITALVQKHEKKIHFIPTKYRVLGGILQSMNIQFGNFIEVLMKNLIDNEQKYEVLKTYTGKKNNTFSLSNINEQLIDKYITKCQTQNINVDNEFVILQKTIFENNKKIKNNFITFKHDIDLLFKDKTTNKIYYLEIKYNDDHDTGKFVDINRKFIKTYAYLLNEFNLKNYDSLVPILFFFNNKKMKGNIYVPEGTNIKRGKTFFDEFLTTSYSSVENYLTELSEDKNTIKNFNNLYKKIIKMNNGR
ncbi:MAG: restriction endonuclease [Treponema sp.]|nr:MAG: restriction endonuclease [Treponema sp.]